MKEGSAMAPLFHYRTFEYLLRRNFKPQIFTNICIKVERGVLALWMKSY